MKTIVLLCSLLGFLWIMDRVYPYDPPTPACKCEQPSMAAFEAASNQGAKFESGLDYIEEQLPLELYTEDHQKIELEPCLNCPIQKEENREASFVQMKGIKYKPPSVCSDRRWLKRQKEKLRYRRRP